MSENPGQVVESVPQASTVPAIADAVPPPSPPSTKELEVIHKVLKIQQVGFYFWTVVYYGLGFLSIILPGVAAMGLYEGKVNQAFAGCGALAAALLGFLKAHELATGFDAAVQLAWITQNDRQLNVIDTAEVAKRLRIVAALTTFRYGEASQQLSSELTARKTPVPPL